MLHKSTSYNLSNTQFHHNLNIQVISLKRAVDRRISVQNKMKGLNLSWSFLDAVDGKKIQWPPSEYIPWKVKLLLGFELTKSEVACFLSHKLAWGECLKLNRTTLVLEDDFLLDEKFFLALECLLKNFDDWEIARLQGISNVSHIDLQEFCEYRIVKNLGDPLGSTAYLIKPSGAHKLLSSSKKIYEPVDHFLEHTKKHQSKIVACIPYPIKSDCFPTTIDDRKARKPIRGPKKMIRSICRCLDRIINNESAWF